MQRFLLGNITFLGIIVTLASVAHSTVSGTGLVLSHSFYASSSQSYSLCLHFIDVEVEVQRGKAMHPRSLSLYAAQPASELRLQSVRSTRGGRVVFARLLPKAPEWSPSL